MTNDVKELKNYTIYDATPGAGGLVLGNIEGRDEEDAAQNWAARTADHLGVDRCEVDEERFVAQRVI